ncbi:hypothetical protein [Naasia aerilata]|uniref:Uncharacterized protein n=1 Tax=Naasia aerilata TaxID=1162966 RepID=A0ABN6XKL6_9MICO|nr:hypothetical protein [Naasia aerilata]BDZ45487.1 hypothetical protein GCM10025866_13960 [Naasia aerilata]
MPRACTVCQSPAKEALEARVASGESIASTARFFRIGADSIRRHVMAHLTPKGLAAVKDTGWESPPDFYARALHLADGLRDSRIAAQAAGRTSEAVRAADGELRALQFIAGKLGLDDAEAVDLTKAWEGITRAALRAVRRDPALGAALADELDRLGDPESAAEFRELAASHQPAHQPTAVRKDSAS